MKKKIVLGMMSMLMLLSVGGCYVRVGGYGRDREYNDHDGNYRLLFSNELSES